MTKIGDTKESYNTNQNNWLVAGTVGVSRSGQFAPLFGVLSSAKGAGWVASTGDGSTTFDAPALTAQDTDAKVYIANFNQS